MMSSVFALIAGVIAIATVTLKKRDPYLLLLLTIAFEGILQSDWTLVGIRVDPLDFSLLGFLYLYIYRRDSYARVGSLPDIYLWTALGVLFTIAYLVAPVSQKNLTDPVRITYQVYRYCWRPLLFYPLAMMVIGSDLRKAKGIVASVFFVGCYFALIATYQGYSGRYATGPFDTKNALGGALVAPSVAALAYVLALRDSYRKRWAIAGAILLVRGVIFSKSRGAFVAIAAALNLLLGFLFVSSVGRSRVLRFAGYSILLIPVVFLIVPDILDRPNVRQLLELVQGSEVKNYAWRREQRWPHFLQFVQENWWFGMGTDRDLTLGLSANTPHNGYLSLALIHGVPAAAIFVFLGAKSALRGFLALWSSRSAEVKLVCLTFASSISGILVHNLVEGTLVHEFVPSVYWTMTGVIAMLVRSTVPVSAGAVGTVGTRRQPPQRRRRIHDRAVHGT